MTDNEKKSFIMYKSFRTMLLRMSMEERGKLISAIYEYIYDGDVSTELGAVVEMAFCAVKDTLDRDMASYAEKCRVNSENGKKGGRPRRNNIDRNDQSREGDFSSPKTERFFEKAKKADNDNDNGNENENENENVNVNDNGDGNGNDNECAGRTEYAVSDLPHPADNEEKNISESELCELRAEGLPKKYVDERLERAAYYAARQKTTVADVLRGWWRDDRARPATTIPLSKAMAEPSGSSFDIDDFFASAMARSALGVNGDGKG